MTAAWLEILKNYGWNVPLQETTWCTTGSDDCHHWKVEVFNECLPRASRAVGFKILGEPNIVHDFHSKIKTLKALHCFEDWDRLFHGRVFKWAGHIARTAQYDPGRLTSRVLQFKCWKWITKVAQSNGGNQLHGKRLVPPP